MGISSNSYGSVAGVATFVKHRTDASGTFTTTTKPTLAEVEGFIDQQSAKLNAWLAGARYVVPVTNAQAVFVLSHFANLGAAGLVELTLRAAGFSATDQNERENEFLAEFAKAEEFIESGALAALGAARSNSLGPLAGLKVGGHTAGGQVLAPIFRRGSFGNDPTAERGTGYEPDYNDL